MEPTPNEASASAVTESVLQPDERVIDLDCLICHNLVVNSVQSPCCGALFCRGCVETWLERATETFCPNCRQPLTKEELQKDAYRERLSANFKRRCRYHESEGCAFVGNREAISVHEKICPKMPITTRLQARIDELTEEKALLTASLSDIQSKMALVERLYMVAHAASSELDSEISDLKSTVEDLKTKLNSFKETRLALEKLVEDTRSSRDAKANENSLLLGMIKAKYRYETISVCVMQRHFVDVPFCRGCRNFKLRFVFQGPWVHVHLHRFSIRNAVYSTTFVLLHPSDDTMNKLCQIGSEDFEENDMYKGFTKWLRRVEFDSYVKHNRFVVGIL